MPRRNAEEKIELYSAKIRKLQSNCNKSRRRRIVYSSSDSEDNTENGTQNIEEHIAETPPAPAPASEQPPPPDANVYEEVILPALDSNIEPASELDPELLQALGDPSDETPVYGPNIHSSLAQRWIPILKKGIQQDTKEKLIKLYTFPDNCRLLKSPSLNAEISAAVADITRNRDKKMQVKQDQLGLGIAAISRAVTLLLTSEDKVQAIKILSDGCRILSDLHFTETQVRKKLITPGLDKSFLSIIDDQDRDDTLFGNNLSEKIKASKAIERQGLQIKKVQQKPSVPTIPAMNIPRSRGQGNWAGPPRYPSSSRGGRTSTYRMPTSSQYRRNQSSTAASTRPSTSTSSQKRAKTRH